MFSLLIRFLEIPISVLRLGLLVQRCESLRGGSYAIHEQDYQPGSARDPLPLRLQRGVLLPGKTTHIKFMKK